MGLCNKLFLMCSLLIALSLALHIFTSPATICNALETTGHRTTQNNKKSTQQENNINPTAETTTHQINVSATKTNFATQSAPDTTRAAVSTSPRPPVFTVHGTDESTSTPAYFTTRMPLGNKMNNKAAGKSELHGHN